MRILIISSQESFRQSVQAACLRYSEAIISLRIADSIGLGLELAVQVEAQLVFVDLTRNLEAGLIAIGQLAQIKNRMVVASADKLTTELLARAIRAGAQEVLTQPPQEDEVHEIISKAHNLLNADDSSQQPPREGKIIVCFSSKGGVGKTTIACNLGVILAGRIGVGRVALIDANTQNPNVAPTLDLRPVHWLRDAVQEYRRLDAEMLRQFMTPHASGVEVLAHSSDNPLGLDFTEDQLSKILLVAKGSYDYIIVDTFPLLSSLNLAIMDLADKILLITESVVPALRIAKYNLQILEQAGYGQNRINVVLNRYTRFRGNVAPEMVAESLNWPIHSVLPYDVHSTIAVNTGKAVCELFPERDLSLALSELADSLTGVKTPPLPVSILEHMINRVKAWLA